MHYTLYLATDAAPAATTEALRPLVESHEADTSSEEESPGVSCIADSPVTITAWSVGWRPADGERYGFAAKLGVDFNLIDEQSVEAKPIMLRDLLALLDTLHGDAVFLDLADNIVLHRVGEKLELNLSCSFWTPELIALVPGTHNQAFRRAAFHAALGPTWTAMEPVRLGRVPAVPGTADRFVTVESDKGRLLRVDLYGRGDAFEDARVWSDFVVIGWGDHVYLVNVRTRQASTFDLEVYFQRMRPTGDRLLVTSGQRMFCFTPDGALLWRSDIVGIDGVSIDRVEGNVIHSSGEWDPPDGWRPFSLDLRTGQRLGAEESGS